MTFQRVKIQTGYQRQQLHTHVNEYMIKSEACDGPIVIFFSPYAVQLVA